MGIRKTFILFAALLFAAANVSAEDKLIKPFILASTSQGEVSQVVDKVKSKLQGAGFEIAGSYSPYEGAVVIAVTNETLKQSAAKTEFGGFGAAQRVTVTKANGQVQVAFTNPVYWANAYQMAADLSSVKQSLSDALGNMKQYGPDEGLSAEDLREYHYKWLMPYFTDRLQLASYDSYDKAVSKVEAALAAEKGGVKEVYRIDIPGKKQTVFGVHMTGPEWVECSGDKYIMERIDFKDVKSTAHLPYEILVTDGKVNALYAEFRIAISFPDLSMMGSNSFASIMCAPSAIENALTEAAGGKASM